MTNEQMLDMLRLAVVFGAAGVVAIVALAVYGLARLVLSD